MAVLAEDGKRKALPLWGWCVLAAILLPLPAVALALPWRVQMAPQLAFRCEPGKWQRDSGISASGWSGTVYYEQYGPIFVFRRETCWVLQQGL